MKKQSKRKSNVILTAVLALLLVLMVVLNIVAHSMSYFLDTYLGRGERTVVSSDAFGTEDTLYYDAPYGTWLNSTLTETSQTQSREAAEAVALEVAKEGIVLLKNDGALPLASGTSITAFGRAYIEPVYGGAGSGGVSTAHNITAMDAMEKAYRVNPDLTAKMRTALPGTPRSAMVTDKYLASTYYIGEFEREVYESAEYADYTDAAIVFIGRTGGEGVDMPNDLLATLAEHAEKGGNFVPNTETARYEEGQHYLELNAEEKDMIDLAAENCDKVIVVLETSNPMELGWLADHESIDAIVWVGGPGAVGFEALASILTGETNPSGRLPDTMAVDFTKNPVWENFGRNIYTNVENLSNPGFDTSKYQLEYDYGMHATFVEYEEGIYLGYRYYETMNELLGAAAEAWYADNVVYPFGYGLSYSDFSQEISDFDVSGDNISVTVKVTNTGSAAGKEVVQLYYASEYTELDRTLGIEKASKNLVAFGKTGILEAGEAESITLSFAKEEMASYSFAYENGAYVLEEGSYTVYLGKNAHDSWGSIVWQNGETKWYTEGNKRESDLVAASNLFADSTEHMKSAPRSMLTRSEGFTEWTASKPEGDELNATDKIKEELLALPYAKSVNYTDPADEPVRLDEDNGLKVINMRGKDYNDPMWDDILAQLTEKDLKNIVRPSMYSNIDIASIGLERMQDADGPQGITSAYSAIDLPTGETNCAWPSEPVVAATFNTELIEKMGKAIGVEALTTGTTGWYAPAMDMHRSPFGGRCFEYYSEDPVLSGKMAAAEVSGAASEGVLVYIKHFALNDQETDRCNNDTEQHTSLIGGGCVWADEQTMREIYFRPFEICVKEATCELKYIDYDTRKPAVRTIRATLGVMSSFNRIGTTWAGGNRQLLTDLLRNEWGFEGTIITDMALYAHMNPIAMYIAGGNDNLGLSLGNKTSYGPVKINVSNPTLQKYIVESVHRMAYAAVNSMPYYGAAPGVKMSYGISPWQKGLYIADAVIGTLLVIGTVWLISKNRKNEKTAGGIM